MKEKLGTTYKRKAANPVTSFDEPGGTAQLSIAANAQTIGTEKNEKVKDVQRIAAALTNCPQRQEEESVIIIHV